MQLFYISFLNQDITTLEYSDIFLFSSISFIGDTMETEIEKIRQNMRKKKQKEIPTKKKKSPIYMTKFLCMVILTLLCLIGLKKSETFKDVFYKNVYEKNFSFAYIKEVYQKYFGSTLPIDKLLGENTETVFSENFTYKTKETYLEGNKFIVENQYLVPVLESGMVVFIGEKEGYGNTIIIQQVDGVDIWYSNITSNVKLYDYIEKGDVLGEASGNYIYMVIKKDGNTLDYDTYTKV